MVEKISTSQQNNILPYNNKQNIKNNTSSESIFLENALQEVKNNQGFLGKFWNGTKEFFNVGLSASDCENMLDKYNSGEISFSEALECIEDFSQKQQNIVELESNILTGVGAIAMATAATAAGPISWGLAIAKGAPIGAILKSGIKMLDRATNDTENDTFDAKQIAKDAISGAMTGATSAVSSGVGVGIKNADASLSILNGAKCGLICGAASGTGSYVTDVAFGDKEFDMGDFAKNTLTSSLVSGTVGAVVGGGMYASASLKGNIGSQTSQTLSETIVSDSTTSTARKVLGRAEQDLITL